MRAPAKLEIDARRTSFKSGLLIQLIDALRAVRHGECMAITAPADVADDLDRWARFTDNAVVASSVEEGGTRFVVRKGLVVDESGPAVGERVWLYTNFDCNLACDYCCVRSSPMTARRPLAFATIAEIARQAPGAGVRDLFVTGGEPFLLDDIGDILAVCSEALPTTVLTNGLLLSGRRRETLRSLSRERVVFQISLDSPTRDLHDAHRGDGTWAKAWRGVSIAREEGFRVRLAATVADDDAEQELVAFLDREGIASRDRVIRRIALRGSAESGLALARADLVPEVTVTGAGVYWHPVGAADDDFFVTVAPLPLRAAIDAVQLAWTEERRFATTLASIFHCA